MQIVVKLVPDRVQDAARIVTERVAQALGQQVIGRGLSVRKVFPEQTSGQRARLFTVNLPNELSSHDLKKVVETLRGDDALEYAEIPAAKRSMASQTSTTDSGSNADA